jgi:hypothetical protein
MPEVSTMSLPRRIAQTSPFVAGVLIGLSLVTPAFAAVVDVPLPPREWLLMGSLVLLAVALAFRLMRSRAGSDANPADDTVDQPDMRWWIRSP